MSNKLVAIILALMLITSYPQLAQSSQASNQNFSKISAELIDKVRASGDRIPVLIEAYAKPYTSIVRDIERLGGSVSFQYKYTDALAATLPADKLATLAANSNVKWMTADLVVKLPTGMSTRDRGDPFTLTLSGGKSADINGDGTVNIIDLATVALAFDTRPGDARWNPAADLNNDGAVNIIDIAAVATHYGRSQELEQGVMGVFPMAEEGEIVPLNPDELLGLEPNNYINSALIKVTPQILADSGSGDASVVAIMDTGINTGHALLNRPGLVVGGVDLSCDSVPHSFCSFGPGDGPLPGFNAFTNNFHGSFVAGIIAASGASVRPATDRLVQSIELYTGKPLPSGPIPGTKMVPLFGIAPKSGLFIIKVFDHRGIGIPESLVIQGMETAIDAKLVQGIDVDVINMSLGGPSLFDGRDLLDKAADQMTKAGIAAVLAAGNDGPAPMTVASAGSANTVITVGAAVDPVHIRVFRDNQLRELGIGSKLFVSNDIQIAAFSSRGPTSDGRAKPDLVASGTVMLSAFAERSNTGLAFASGTSFSTPGVAAAIALLNSIAEKNGMATSPFDYKQAIVGTADPIPGYGVESQGAGYLNVAGALTALKTDAAHGDSQAPLSEDGKIVDISNIPDASPGQQQATFTFPGITLAPGHKRDFIFAVHDLESLTVQVKNVNLGTNNPFGVNSFEVYIKGARRTASLSDYHVFGANTFGDATFTVTDDLTNVAGAVMLPPRIRGVQIDAITTRAFVVQRGFYKITLENDFTSADILTGDLTISYVRAPIPAPPANLEFSGVLKQGEATDFITIDVPSGTKRAILELSFTHDWSIYPSADLDLLVFNGTMFDASGATLRSPERVAIVNPATKISVAVEAFTIPQGMASEAFVLQVQFFTM